MLVTTKRQNRILDCETLNVFLMLIIGTKAPVFRSRASETLIRVYFHPLLLLQPHYVFSTHDTNFEEGTVVLR